jgi:hypothetical protein
MRSHDLDPFSLVMGIVLALTGLAFLLVHIDPAELHLERVWPVPLIGLGLLVVILAAASPREREQARTPNVLDDLDTVADEDDEVRSGPPLGL